MIWLATRIRTMRPGTWVGILIAAIGVAVAVAAEDPMTEGNPEAWIAVGAIVLGIVAAAAINAYQDHARARPCPRCGERVAVGQLECPHCDFDFRSIGT
jgi:drug/metabolite transporter (DMT)-like permease